MDENAPVSLAECALASGACLEVFVHDYHAICPRINLVGSSGLYCGEPDEISCNNCLAVSIQNIEEPMCRDIREWRARYRILYGTAERVIVPDDDVAKRLRRHLPDARIVVHPYEPIVAPPERGVSSFSAGMNLRIVVIGAVSKIKGSDVLEACSRDAGNRRLPLDFILMGYSWNDRLLSTLGVTVTGRYCEAEAAQMLDLLAPHLVWLPSISPETFSYTLSLALARGYDVAAFDLGAVAGRLRRAGRGDLLMPLEWALEAQRINDTFLDYRAHLIDCH